MIKIKLIMEKFRLNILFILILGISYPFKKEINALGNYAFQVKNHLIYSVVLLIVIGIFGMCLKLKIPKFILRHSINNSKILRLLILILKFFYRLIEYFFSIKALTNTVIIISIFLGLIVLKKINHFEFIGALIYTTLSFMTVCLGALLIKGKYKKFSSDEKIELLSTMIFFVLTIILQCYIQYKC